ncbi:MAG: amidohydrolase family protein [Gemmatimonadetes bacterium]|nr:amidohydrolase family protein [Gemmatimonadota bacterium]
MKRRAQELILAVTAASWTGCAPDDRRAAPEADATEETHAFVGATILDGSGAPPLADGVLLVRGGRIQEVGSADAVRVPADAIVTDVTGRFIVPGLINAHGHVGGTLGLESGHYDRANLVRQLELYARYGVTTVVSLGGDGEEGVALREEQATESLARSRLFVAGAVVVGETPGEAIEMVDGNAALGADFIKIRVDDNLGATVKMTPEVYGAVIERAHDLGLPVASHLFYLEDAHGLLDAGVDFVVHSVRDRDVDPELAHKLIEQDVCYTPTLVREYVIYAYEEVPEFFSDPFFLAEADTAVLARLSDPEAMARVADDETAQRYKEALVQAQTNLGLLSEAGVTIAMGTDTGPPTRFQGYFEHVELELMKQAGMSEMEILVASTGDAARCTGRDDVGELSAGRWADFIVLEADPLEDISNLRAIDGVWIAGNRIPALGS